MDFFGIGAAIGGVVSNYFRQARQSGRTERLIENLRDGDRVIFVNSNHAEKVKRACKERKISVKFEYVDPRYPRLDFQPVTGRCFVDHVWLEEYYKLRLADCANDVDVIQKRCGRAPVVNMEMAEQNENRWRF